MSDIFINTEISRPPRPGQGNNCNGHFTSIANGGNDHIIGDGCGCGCGCGCDNLNPETNIDFIAPMLLMGAVTIIYLKFKTSH